NLSDTQIILFSQQIRGIVHTILSHICKNRISVNRFETTFHRCGKVVGNHEGIINFTTEDVLVGEKKYSVDEFTSRVAGLIAGTP
ncbi:hypothetical protein ACTPEF_24170, partial [Clostridioides difficile]